MGLFGNILNKIFHHDSAEAARPVTVSQPGTARAQATPVTRAAGKAATPGPRTSVDVAAVLAAMASMKGDQAGNYQSSIVDLLRLLDLDPGLAARKALADELGVKAGEHGSAEQNIALHRAVMDQLAANGGIVPDSLRQ